MDPLVKITVSLLISVKKEETGNFVVKCPLLNIVTQGSSKRNAVENLKEEIGFLFSSCVSDNSLIAVMDERTAHRTKPFARGEFVKIETAYIDLPAGVPPELLSRFADAAKHPA